MYQILQSLHTANSLMERHLVRVLRLVIEVIRKMEVLYMSMTMDIWFAKIRLFIIIVLIWQEEAYG